MLTANSHISTNSARAPRPQPISVLDERRIQHLEHSFVTRRVPKKHIATLLRENLEPEIGDVILVRVARIGRFNFIEGADSTIIPLRLGQELIVSYAPMAGTRDAVGVIPAVGRRFQLLNPAGIASNTRSRAYADGQATELECVGILADNRGVRINLAGWAIPTGYGHGISKPVIAVIGERIMPGEPCRSADIIRGLSQSGFRVGAANITGVPGCWKVTMLRKSGADVVVDITDAGYLGVSSLNPRVLERVFLSLTGHLAECGVDISVLEMEQGVFGSDTASIISLPSFQSRISNIVLESRPGREAELERDSLRALGFDVTLMDAPAERQVYKPLI